MIPRLVPEIEGWYPERDGGEGEEEGAEGLVLTYSSKVMSCTEGMWVRSDTRELKRC